MDIAMISIGSTGDVRPYILLARELKNKGYNIKFCAFMDFENDIKKEGFEFIPIMHTAKDYMQKVLNSNNGGIDYINKMYDELKTLAPALFTAIDTVVQACDIVISTYFGSFSKRVAEKYNKLYVQTHFFPMDINNVSPIASAKGFSLGKGYYHFTYKLGYMFINILEKYFTKKIAPDYDIQPNEIKSKPVYKINGKNFPVIYAMSKYVFPPYSNWEDNIHVVGYFFDKKIQEYHPSQELMDFINDGEQPIYVGFGSIMSEKLEKYLDITLRALNRTGIRAIVVKGWKNFNVQSNRNIFISDALPHDFIFQHVKAVVHHGGAGTFAAGLKYGKPTYIVPFGGDQPFNALRAYKLGIGPKPLKQEFFTVRKMSKCLIDLVENDTYRINAIKLSKRIRQENGLDKAVAIIEDYINANKA